MLFVSEIAAFIFFKTGPGKRKSLAEVTSEVGGFTYVLSGFFAMLVLARRSENIRILLRSDGRCFRDVIFPVLLASPFIVSGFRKIAMKNRFASICTEVLCMHPHLTLVSFFIIYGDILSNLTRRNLRILKSIREEQYMSHSIAAKWEVRDGIREMNSLFTSTLALCYIEFFVAVVFLFAKLVGQTLSITDKLWLLVNASGIVLQLYLFSRMSSKFTSISLETEYHLLKRSLLETSPEVMVFRFREEWDVPRCAVFAQSVPNFLRYLASTVTCVAVILQFDFKVLGEIADLGLFMISRE